MEFEGRLPEEGINTSKEHPLREFFVLVGGLVGGAVLFVTVVAVSIDLLVPLLPPSWEVRIFSADWLAPDAEGESEPRDVALQELLDRLLAHAPESPYTFRVGVLEDPQPNAMAFPGGSILVTSGLLDAVESENELALVLGHELGHYAGRDHLRGLGRSLAWAFVAAALGSSGADVATGLADLAAQVTQRGFDRDQESDADRFGLALVQAEYGHVAGASDFFTRGPDDLFTAGFGGELESYLSTHPMDDDRIEALHREAQRRGWTLDGTTRPLAAVLRSPADDGDDAEVPSESESLFE
ncbi:MAG: M48 family metallopeptidase [Myxococcota bacterium]